MVHWMFSEDYREKKNYYKDSHSNRRNLELLSLCAQMNTDLTRSDTRLFFLNKILS